LSKIRGFAILSTQRTGSSMLVRSLDSHPNLLCAGEIFKLNDSKNIHHSSFSFTYKRARELKLIKSIRLFTRVFIKIHLDTFFSSNDNVKVGFKLMLDQVQVYPYVLKYLTDRNIKIIFLYRENIILQAISYLIAKSTGVWVVDGEKYTHKMERYEININELFSEVERFDDDKKEIIDLSGRYPNGFAISYEEMTTDFEYFDSKIQAFLLVNRMNLVRGTKKIALKPLEEIIVNFDEIKSHLEETKYHNYVI